MSAGERKPPRDSYPGVADEEISFVDLAKILIRRRWWIVGTALAVFVLVFGIGSLTRNAAVYSMTTIYEAATQSSDAGNPQPLQSVGGLIRRLETIQWPALTRAYLADNPRLDSMPFELSITNPGDTDLVVLQSEATEDQHPSVEQLHRQLAEGLVALEEERIVQRRNILAAQLERVEATLAETQALIGGEPEMSLFINERLIGLYEQQVSLQIQLDGLQAGNVIHVAARGDARSSGPGLTLLLALGIVLGGFVGLMAAFLVEFAGRVRDSLEEDLLRPRIKP